MKEFMLESLRELQTTLLLLLERTNQTQVHEGWTLEWVLTDVIDAYRNLRADTITWREALTVYQVASNVQIECDRAALDVEMVDNLDWQYARKLVKQPTPTAGRGRGGGGT